MITTDQLFAESFEPFWLIQKKYLAIKNLDDSLIASADFIFKQNAIESMQRISSRCDKRGNYTNML